MLLLRMNLFCKSKAMRISIPDEIIELAKKHPEKKREIYWDAVAYIVDHDQLKWKWLLEYVDTNMRRSKNMKDKKNRLGRTKNKTWQDLNLRPATSKKISPATTKKARSKPKEQHGTDEALTIYISNNKEIYDIVYKYVYSNIDTWNIKYLINKHWEQKYIYSQMLEAEKVINDVWLETFATILAYIKHDEFRNKQILSIAKLNRKNKDGVPYYVVIMDLIRNYKPKVLTIPTI